MKAKVELLAFGERGQIRWVDINESTDGMALPTLLENVFIYGQNDYQPIPGIRSVSVNDVIHLDNSRLMFRITPAGFDELTPEQYEEHRKAMWNRYPGGDL